jgi:hypothetical protein
VRLAVDGGGFVAAGTAARTANQVAALLHDSLSGKLGGFGAMAGNDATSIDFARSYDAASAEALDALADLSAAFIGLGSLIHATDDNHRRAEAASAGLTVSAYSGLDLHEDDYVRVVRSRPPSSLGAQEPGFGEVETWILDRIEGFVWPGADVGRLRDAASTWRNAATGVDDLVDYCERASVEVGRQTSPEIPLALDAIDDLRRSVRGLGDELGELARMCDEYAAGVETAHERTRALLAEVAQMIVEGLVLSAAVGLITGGTASGVVASATVARVLEQAPRFQALLIALRDAASVCASRLRTAREGAVAVRARLEKFLRVEARNERGEMKLPGDWARARARRPARPLPRVEDAKLKNYVDHLFKGTVNEKRIGDGTTMDAIRSEIATGLDTHGKLHTTKGSQILRGLEKWLRQHPEASSDRDLAQSLADELKDALNR